MCNQAVDSYEKALEFAPDCCKTREICDKAVNT